MERLGTPDLAIASAGIVIPGEFLQQEPEVRRREMSVNYHGSAAFAHVIGSAMARRGSGRIVFLSSAAGLAGIFGLAGYCATKFAVRGLAEALSVELAPHGVGVTICYPPDVDTPMLEAERPLRPAITRAIAGNGNVLSADAVAAAMLRGIDRGRFVVAPGTASLGLAFAGSATIPYFRWLQHRIVRRLGRENTDGI